MRPIDADGFKKIVSSKIDLGLIGHPGNDYAKFLESIKKMIDVMPTLDFGPVIRCKDCKHSFYDEKNDDWWCCRLFGSFRTDPENFCSHYAMMDEEVPAEMSVPKETDDE